MKLKAKATLMILLGILVTTIIADLIIDALTPVKTTAFYYRLVANICIVVIFAIIWVKKVDYKMAEKIGKRSTYFHGTFEKMDKRSNYLRGIGVGLVISWVTSAIAYLKGGQSALLSDLILLELILSVIFISLAYLINTEK